MPSALPQLPDRYVDGALVARGGMGEVWRARDTQLDRDVALKLLTPGSGAEPEETRRARFEREARAIAQLSSHPNVVTVYDIGEADGAPWMAMEWLDGGSLAERLPAGPVPHEDALRWLRQVASALDAAHAAGIVHRDVKPGNVLFTADGDARVGDFGIARWSMEAASTLTQAGAVIGTASYMSPEQARGEQVGPPSDQYSLLVIAWQLLVGERPFARDSAVAELAAHANEPPPSAAARAKLPPDVDPVFERALAKQPEDRWPSCTAAVAALESALEQSLAPTRVLAAAPTVPLAPSAAAPRSPRRQPTSARASRAPLVLAAIVLLGVLGAVALAATDDPPSPARSTGTEKPVTTERQSQAEPERTAAPEPAPEPVPEPEPSAEQVRAAAIERHEEAFELLQAGRFEEALTLAQSALADLGGVAPYEAYANYNVGAALVGLGRCGEALPYLDRSEQLQGHRDEIDAARAACSEGDDDKPGKGAKRDKEDREGKDD